MVTLQVLKKKKTLHRCLTLTEDKIEADEGLSMVKSCLRKFKEIPIGH